MRVRVRGRARVRVRVRVRGRVRVRVRGRVRGSRLRPSPVGADWAKDRCRSLSLSPPPVSETYRTT